MSFYEYKSDNRMYLRSTLFDPCNIAYGFTSSLGGVSHGKINGLNLGFRVGDNEAAVKANYDCVASDLGIELNRTVLSKQTHTDNLRIVTEKDCGKGIICESDIEDTDGLITNQPNIALIVFSADCVPLLFFDPEEKVAAAVHSGWRGTVKNIGGKCVDTMMSQFNCKPENIKVTVGPSIGSCCFDFGEDAVNFFKEKYLTPINDGKFKVDLWTMIFDNLTEKGILPENIDISRVCTVCNNHKYYSYRSHKENTGRQGAVIMIKG